MIVRRALLTLRPWAASAPAISVLAVSVMAVSLGAAQPPAAPPPFLGGAESPEVLAERLAQSTPRRFRPVGTTSVTLRVELGEGTEAAFKPRTRAHPRGFQSEIAAYRIARALGMDNVPPAVLVRYPRPLLEGRFTADHPDDWEPVRREILWDAPGIARGAAIHWIPRMERTELSTLAGLEGASAWLRQGAGLPPSADATARDLSTMIAFDYLIGNWDRFSGGNVSTDGTGRLFVRDHNVSFQAPLTPDRYARLRGHLERVERFSASFVARLGALDRAGLEGLLATDDDGVGLLVPAQVDGLLARRDALLSYVAAQCAIHGARAVLAWE